MSQSPSLVHAAPRAGAPRRVLVLCYRFPPQGGGGVQRTLKMIGYIRQYGWQPVVHTVSNPYWPVRDETLARHIPDDVPVYRTPTIEYERLEAGLVGLLARSGRTARGGRKAAVPAPRSQGSAVAGGDGASLTSRAEGSAADPTIQGSTPATRVSERELRLRRGGRIARLQDWIWSRVLVPDPQIAWLPTALVRSLWIARRERVTAIYSTSPPNSVNVLAMAVARFTGLPWVADMRDPWTDGLRRRQWYEGNPRRRALEAAWERRMFERAAHVLVSAEPLRDTLAEKYADLGAGRVSVMTNGFDPADFAHVTSTPRFLEPGLLHLTNSGNVESMFDALPFFDVVREVVEGDPAIRAILRVNYLGTKRQPQNDEFIARHRLDDVIRYFPYMSHPDAIQHLAESQALLMCQIPVQESAGVKLSGKMFEYFYLRKPIVALTIKGLTASLLERSGLGRIAAPGDRAAIRAILDGLIHEFRHGGVHASPDEAFIATFDRQLQVRRLAEILDAAVAGRS